MLYSTISLQLDIYVIILRDGAIAVIQRLAVAQFDLRALHHIAELLLWEQEGIIVNVKLAAAVLTQNRAVIGPLFWVSDCKNNNNVWKHQIIFALSAGNIQLFSLSFG